MKTKNVHIEEKVWSSEVQFSCFITFSLSIYSIQHSSGPCCLTTFSADSFIAHFLLYHVLQALFRFIVLNVLLCESHCSILCILVSTEHFSTVVSKSEKNYSHIAQQSVCVYPRFSTRSYNVLRSSIVRSRFLILRIPNRWYIQCYMEFVLNFMFAWSFFHRFSLSHSNRFAALSSCHSTHIRHRCIALFGLMLWNRILCAHLSACVPRKVYRFWMFIIYKYILEQITHHSRHIPELAFYSYSNIMLWACVWLANRKKNSSPTDEMNNGRAKNIHFNREVEN